MDAAKASPFQVIDEKGMRGTLDLTVVPPQGSESRLVLVRFDDGSQIFVNAATFTETEPGSFAFPGSFAELLNENQSAKYGAQTFGESGEIVIPLLAEELNVVREKVLTGGVRVHKTVEERSEIVDEPTLKEEIDIERVAVNQFVTEAPPPRYEGDVTIVPLLEEVLVVEKRLVLREEIRIVKRRDTVRNPQQIVLRRENATLEEIQPEARRAETQNSASVDNRSE